MHVKSRGSIAFICNNMSHHFMVIHQQIHFILCRYVWTLISMYMYPAYVQWRSHPIKISLTFVDKTPGARNQMQRPDVYLQVEGLILWACHHYVFHISLSVHTVSWNSYTSINRWGAGLHWYYQYFECFCMGYQVASWSHERFVK